MSETLQVPNDDGQVDDFPPPPMDLNEEGPAGEESQLDEDNTKGTQTPEQTPVDSPRGTGTQTPGRRSSLAPPDSELINISKRSGRRGSQAYLLGDDTIVMQFENGKRRLSSFCTSSSNDETIINVDENMTEEEMMETLRAHKQIIGNVKTQCWPMHRKLKVLRRAKLYIKKQEGDLKQSKQAKDIVATFKTFLEKSINRLKREIDNLVVQLTPWEMRIKKIESQFGSVVASYFTFLRWVFWINTFISFVICCLLMVPEVLRGPKDPTGMRKEVEDSKNALDLKTIWEFRGYLQYSPIFYGYYSNEESTDEGYRLPLAYFLTSLFMYMMSFFFILRQMAKNARETRVGSKEDEYTFTWKLYTGWDFMIGNSETAYNKVASIVMSFREAILEEKERSKPVNDWKLITRRIIANLMVLFLLVASAYAVYLVVDRSTKMPEKPDLLRENEVTLVVSGINAVFPSFFSLIGILEDYHPRIQLRWQLARVLVLNLLNLYTLMFSQFNKVDTMTSQLSGMKRNLTIEKALRMGYEIDFEALEQKENNRVKRHDGRYVVPSCDFCDVHDHKMSTEGTIVRYDELDYEFHDGRPRGSKVTPFSSTTKPPWIFAPIAGNTTQGGKKETDTHATPSTKLVTTSKTVTTEASTVEKVTKSIIRPKYSTTVTPPKVITTTTTTTTTQKSTNDATKNISSSTQATTSTRTSSTLIAENVTISTTEKTTSVVTNYDKASTTKTVTKPTITTTVNPWRPTPPPQECSTKSPLEIVKVDSNDLINITEEVRTQLKDLCWETMFGQELAKLTVMDLVVLVVSSLFSDFFRAFVVRYCNHKACFFWDLEMTFPGYPDFAIAENILHLVTNQGQVWLGMFFSPGLPAINTVKLCIMMYIRSWAVLSCNIPHETVFKASGSNNFYYALLLLMLFICSLPVGYVMVWLEPSWHCGPFSQHERVYHVFTKFIESMLPDALNRVVAYLTSPGAVIPLILLLVLIIYYLVATMGALKDANSDLKAQLRKEKEEVVEGNKTEGEPAVTIPSNAIATPATEKKHVRINEEIASSDKSKLLSNLQGETA